MHFLLEVKRQRGPGLYRLVFNAGPDEIVAMCEDRGDGWWLSGALDVGPYPNRRRAVRVFELFAQAVHDAGGPADPDAWRAGQKMLRSVDRRAPLPRSAVADPLPGMMDGPLPVEAVDARAAEDLDPAGAWALLRAHRAALALHGADPHWPADRLRLIEAGYADLLWFEPYELAEVVPYIHA